MVDRAPQTYRVEKWILEAGARVSERSDGRRSVRNQMGE
ncbi:hypothetical protein C4K22_0512 [Pseudomonas chlororaphis subsp. aurantiaca]|nr:hypothetical protein C4K23_0492 [Pseudomonas chlororaphis]AZD33284.1 hypothetical protein C4K22_0512 [Pseudomonas chlororaphis subsp. aurantiaca]AZD83370.1 hypothetical protein C4K14_0517 [Pseudomonas chlororaphis subsp. aureofaciens]AZD39616.1 hypothetical protein C4K21_0513 [Pseudomonas chlororaphis subsp. aurantiaca]AZD45948.1 hypothetical protein C4K20_0504 [Pseudomonas chlororaphis subsp. aurantiaca]